MSTTRKSCGMLGRVILICSVLAGGAGWARGDIITIASWDFDTEATYLTPNTVGDNVTVPDITSGSSANPAWLDLSEETISNTTMSTHSAEWTGALGQASGGVLRYTARGFDSAANPNRYVEFSVTTDPGYTFTPDTLLLDFGRTDDGHNQARFLEVRYSLDSFDTYVDVGEIRTDGNSDSGNRYGRGILDLAALEHSALDNLSGTLTFRFYSRVGTSSDTIQRNFGIDNLTLTGSVIPEPGSVLLIGFGGLILTGLRRWRRRA